MNAAGTVVVSGAGTGIGRAVARRLADSGFHVTGVGRRKEPLDQLAAERGGAAGRGGQIAVIAADVATELGAAAVATQVASGRVARRGLVNGGGRARGA